MKQDKSETMKQDKSDFGLIEINQQISADDGKTFLPTYENMSMDDFQQLIEDIEYWSESVLTDQEIENLKDIIA